MNLERVSALRERLYAIAQELFPELGPHGAAATLRFVAEDIELQARAAGAWNAENYAELCAMNAEFFADRAAKSGD